MPARETKCTPSHRLSSSLHPPLEQGHGEWLLGPWAQPQGVRSPCQLLERA